MSEKPADADASTAQRLAKVLVWKTGFRRAVEVAVQDDWCTFEHSPDYKTVIERFAEEFARRLTACMFSDEGGTEALPSFRELATVYRNQFWPEAKSPDEVVQGCWGDFHKLLERSLVSHASKVIPRLTFLMQDWVSADGTRVGDLEDVFTKCFAMSLQGGSQVGQSQSVVSANTGGLKEEVRAKDENSAQGTKEAPTPEAASASAVKTVTTTPATPTNLSRMSSDEWREEVKAISKTAGAVLVEAAGGLLAAASATEKTGKQITVASDSKPKAQEKEALPKGESVAPVPWQYKPVPEGPDKHDEYDARMGNSPEGYAIVGGRVRGKKHKHEGTNCDDWFEFATTGSWTVLAVSDGGGSYKFSRVGAKISCQTVVERLAVSLAGPECAELEGEARGSKSEDLPKLSAKYREVVGNAIKGAMRDALQAVLKRIAELNIGFEYHRENSGGNLKPLSLRDFYATLLVAVHAPLRMGDKSYSFVMGCGCGDGMIGVVSNSADPEKACTLLMKPDSGEFSGEVDFLNEKALGDDAMQGRLYPGVFGELKALMLMTDGVADDCFPNNPGIASVYADLVLNRIVPVPAACSDEEFVLELKDSKVKSADEFRRIKANVPVYRILPEGPKQVEVASVALLGQELGLEKERLASNYRLLSAASGTLADPMPEISKSEDRLVQWLDAYTVRGSFDDRTLLIMAPKVKS